MAARRQMWAASTAFIVEVYGGIARKARAALGRLSARATGHGATDRTKYGLVRNSPNSFFTHHSQQISKAAVVYDAMAIRKQILSLRQRVMVGAHAPACGVAA